MDHGPWDSAWGSPRDKYFAGGYLAPVQRGDDGRVVNSERPAMETTIEVERTKEEVRVLVTIGKQITTYKLNAVLAKSLGEDLFKAGCNLEAEQGATGTGGW